MWSDLAIFLAVSRQGSASRAARELGTSVSTVTRRLAALEAEVGRALFVRTPTGLEPTAAAHALRPHAESAERAVHAGRAAIDAMDATPRGAVTIGLPGDMTVLVLLPRLKPFLDAHPELELSLDTGLALADLERREADVAVRVALPPGDSLVARRLRTVDWAAFSTPAALEGVRDASDPAQHAWIGGLDGSAPEDDFGPAFAGVRYRIRCTTPVHVRHAVASGLGAAVMPALFGELTPGLVRLPIETRPPTELYLVTHRAMRHSPRVAAVWDMLIELLAEGDPAEEHALLADALEAAYGFGVARAR
ncbi:MAG: LysR family transcriptional regulator [Alphaproteobacteria bacterium]|nr:LysR family transcriptional regulator [Alphaproteobacteria bacterium]